MDEVVRAGRKAKPNIKKKPPTAEQVKQAREAAKHTTWHAANVIYVSTRQWQKYESGKAKMHPAVFDLYLIKTGQFQPASPARTEEAPA